MRKDSLWRTILQFEVCLILGGLLIVIYSLRGNVVITVHSFELLLGTVGLPCLLFAIHGFFPHKATRDCTETTIGKLEEVHMITAPNVDAIKVEYEFSFYVKEEKIQGNALEVEDIYPGTPVGTKVTIWYNPENPHRYFVAEEPLQNINRRILPVLFTSNLIFVILGVLTLLQLI